MTLSESSNLKIVDKRMFTREGELREEYRFLERTGEDGDAGADEPAEETPEPPAEPAASSPADSPESSSPEPPEAGRVDLPEMPGVGSQPDFVDLLSLLAEPAAIYLGDAPLPDGRRAEDLDMARLHIDLLDVLRKKTLGNLSAQESAVLEDILYRLRMRYVQKRD